MCKVEMNRIFRITATFDIFACVTFTHFDNVKRKTCLKIKVNNIVIFFCISSVRSLNHGSLSRGCSLLDKPPEVIVLFYIVTVSLWITHYFPLDMLP